MKTKSFLVDQVLLLFSICLLLFPIHSHKTGRGKSGKPHSFVLRRCWEMFFNLSLKFILQKKIMSRLTFYMFGDLAATKAKNLQWKAKFEALNT